MVRNHESENSFFLVPQRESNPIPEYRLDTLTTELWRTHGEQGCKLGSYVRHMPCYTARLKYVEMTI